MDLALLDTSAPDGAEMVVRHPETDAPLMSDDGPVTLRVTSVDSEAWAAARRENTNARISAGKATVTAEDLEEEGMRLIVRVTLGWRNVTVDGKPLTFSPENARKLYKRFPWLRDQVDRFIGRRANFLRPAPTISEDTSSSASAK